MKKKKNELPQACNIGEGCGGAAEFFAVATECKVLEEQRYKMLEVQSTRC